MINISDMKFFLSVIFCYFFTDDRFEDNYGSSWSNYKKNGK